MKTFNQKLRRVFNRKANGDTDEVSGLGKGARWAIFAILVAIIVGGVTLFVTNYSNSASTVSSQMDELNTQLDNAQDAVDANF